jgi:hypothetical protein
MIKINSDHFKRSRHFPITRDQRVALKRIFDRDTIMHNEVVNHAVLTVRTSYREYRSAVQPTFGCDGAITLYWAGMWLAIEKDGYTHS